MVIRNDYYEYDVENDVQYPQLKIEKPLDRDQEKEIIRIDPKVCKEYSIEKNSIVEILNPKTQDYTAGIVFPSIKRDYGTHILRISEITRKNLNLNVSDYVKIQIIKEEEAQIIILAGFDAPSLLRNPKYISSKLKNRIITKDDIIELYSYGCKYNLLVMDYLPKCSVVKITEKTTIQMRKLSCGDKLLFQNIPLSAKNLILGDMKLLYAPDQALNHYKKAIKFNSNKEDPSLLQRIAVSYLKKGIQDNKIKPLIHANFYLEKIKKKFIEMAYSITQNLQELNELMVKTEFSQQDLEGFDFPLLMFKET